ncbi:hypothetical protein DXG03_002951 [Asterophora parasitica]|uniref:Uncharacterized protein n=1 Tax=Asterophora parasitica TaxID=117018 RepID=A0A9P7KC03_9AGAR|nr:hypothetical protein DXG03_002951 [Asterophora parasitica]
MALLRGRRSNGHSSQTIAMTSNIPPQPLIRAGSMPPATTTPPDIAHSISATTGGPPPASSSAVNNVGPGATRRTNITSKEERRRLLVEDEWADDVQPTSVKCRGCMKTVCLDGRSEYYPGLWHKHRGKCPQILQQTGKEIPKRKPRTAKKATMAPTAKASLLGAARISRGPRNSRTEDQVDAMSIDGYNGEGGGSATHSIVDDRAMIHPYPAAYDEFQHATNAPVNLQIPFSRITYAQSFLQPATAAGHGRPSVDATQWGPSPDDSASEARETDSRAQQPFAVGHPSPVHHRYRFSSQREIDSYYSGSYTTSAQDVAPPVDQEVLDGARLLVDFAQSMRQRN